MNIIKQLRSQIQIHKVIAVLVVLKLMGYFSPIELSNQAARSTLQASLSYLLLLFGFAWVLIKLFEKVSGVQIVLSAVASFFVAAFFLFSAFFVYMGCTEEGSSVSYLRSGESAKIVMRRFNCGATTDYDDSYYYVQPLTSYFNYVRSVDTLAISRDKWRRVVNEPTN